VNVARLRAPVGSPAVQAFVAAVDPVDRLADASPGFVWRLLPGEGHVVTAAPHDGRMVVNLSVWESYEALHDFVYRSVHGGLLRRRSRWFEPVPQPAAALWWVPSGHRPGVAEALARLDHLRAYGPSVRAFSLRRRFEVDGRPVARRRAGSR
jgi:hypothetical protein